MSFYGKSRKAINAADREEYKELHACAARGSESQLLRALAKSNSSVNQTTSTHQLTPLNIAVIRGHTECIPILLNAGAQFLEKNPSLCIAIRLKKAKIALMLIKEMQKRDPSAIKQLESGGHYPLVIAARTGSTTVAAALIEAKADKHNGPVLRESPILTASRNGSTKIVLLLLQHAPSLLNIKDFNGATPLYHATYLGREKTVRALLDAKATFTWELPKASPLKMSINREKYAITGLLLSQFIEKKIPLHKLEMDKLETLFPQLSLAERLTHFFTRAEPPPVVEPLKYLQTPSTLLFTIDRTDILFPGARKIVGEYAKPSNLEELTPYLTKR